MQAGWYSTTFLHIYINTLRMELFQHSMAVWNIAEMVFMCTLVWSRGRLKVSLCAAWCYGGHVCTAKGVILLFNGMW